MRVTSSAIATLFLVHKEVESFQFSGQATKCRSSVLNNKQQLCTRLFAGFGRAATNVDPYSGLLNKMDGSPPAPIIDKITVDESAMKIIDDLTESVTNAANEAAAAASSFGSSDVDASVAQTAIEEVSKVAAEATASASAAAQSVASAFDGTFKSVFERTIPGMKAKAAGSSVVAAGTAPTLADFIAGKRQALQDMATTNNAAEKLEIMKSNLLGLPGLNAESLASGDPAAVVKSYNFYDLMDAFKIREYGAWYLVVAAVLIAVGQRSAGEEEARRVMEQDLKIAEEKAALAAEAAARAAEGAKKVKELVVASQSSQKVGQDDKLKELEKEQLIMKKKLQIATKEANELRAKLQKLLGETPQSSPVIQEHIPVKEEPVVAVTTEIGRESEPVAKKSTVKVNGSAEPKAAAKPKPEPVVATKTAPAPSPKVKPGAKIVVAEPKPVAKTVVAEPEPVAKPVIAESKPVAKTVVAEPKPIAKTVLSEPKPVAKIVVAEPEPLVSKTKTIVAEPEIFVANPEPVFVQAEATAATDTALSTSPKKTTKKVIEPVANSAASPSKSTTKSKTPKKAKVAPAAAPEPVEAAPAPQKIDHPWASLTDSSLQRKTVRELTGFLTEKGVEIKDANGKPLLKKDLVERVKKLL